MWHGWQYQAVQDPNYISNFTFWGWRWSRIAMRTCFSALTVPVLENLFSKRSLTLRCFKGEIIVIVVIISYSWQFFQNGKITRYSHVLCSFQRHDQTSSFRFGRRSVSFCCRRLSNCVRKLHCSHHAWGWFASWCCHSILGESSQWLFLIEFVYLTKLYDIWTHLICEFKYLCIITWIHVFVEMV